VASVAAFSEMRQGHECQLAPSASGVFDDCNAASREVPSPDHTRRDREPADVDTRRFAPRIAARWDEVLRG
jgi:hypothetical protein